MTNLISPTDPAFPTIGNEKKTGIDILTFISALVYSHNVGNSGDETIYTRKAIESVKCAEELITQINIARSK